MPVYQHRRNDIYTLMQRNPSSQKITRESFNFADKIIPASTVFYQSNFSYAFTNIRCVLPGRILYEKYLIFLLVVIFPYTKIDVLVSSIRPAARLENLTPEEVSDLFQTAVAVQKAVEKEYEADSSTICVQDGKHAGQTVPVICTKRNNK